MPTGPQNTLAVHPFFSLALSSTTFLSGSACCFFKPWLWLWVLMTKNILNHMSYVNHMEVVLEIFRQKLRPCKPKMVATNPTSLIALNTFIFYIVVQSKSPHKSVLWKTCRMTTANLALYKCFSSLTHGFMSTILETTLPAPAEVQNFCLVACFHWSNTKEQHKHWVID